MHCGQRAPESKPHKSTYRLELQKVKQNPIQRRYNRRRGGSKRGAKVYIAARNESKATAAISRIEAWNPSSTRGQILFHKLELDDPRDAKKSAEAFLARESRLDILGECLIPIVLALLTEIFVSQQCRPDVFPVRKDQRRCSFPDVEANGELVLLFVKFRERYFLTQR